MSSRNIIILIIILQIIFIAILSNKIYIKHQNIAGVSNINPIHNKDITRPSSTLQYYYEFVPNTINNEQNIFWLKNNVSYVINADGLHESIDYPITKKQDVFRIITLGDSFTFGMFVDTKNNWTEILENYLNTNFNCKNYKNFEVLNLGIGGYDIQYSLERFKMRGQKYDADLIIWFLKNDDFEEINEIMRRKEQEYIREMKKTGEYEKKIEEGKPYPFVEYIRRDMSDYIEKVGSDVVFNEQKDYINEFMNIYKNKKLFITFPSTHRKYRKYLSELQYSNSNNNYLEITDLFDVKRNSNLTFYPHDFHPTAEGHEVIAEDIYQYLTKNKIIPCD